MNRRLAFFVITTTLALIAALLVHGALKNKEARIQALQQSTVQIVVAAHPLAPGDSVDSGAVRLVSWPRAQVPPGALMDVQSALGRIARSSLSTDEPIIASMLLEADKTGGVLPLLIPEGMRAMSVAVDDISDMAGFVLPHSRVDVVVSIPPPNGTSNAAQSSGDLSKIVLQNVEVLAVGESLQGDPDQPHPAKVVTLLVTPEDAERLAAAARLGNLQLAMRNYADQQRAPTGGVSVAALRGESYVFEPPLTQPVLPPPPQQPVDHRPPRRAQRVRAVEVIRNGIEHQIISFRPDGRIVIPPAQASAAPTQ
jgi:pilus assembly protein CpaB